jgi:hypothetical protein
MIRIGRPAVDYLLGRIGETGNPCQLALSLYAIQRMGCEHLVQWDGRMVGLLIAGLADNGVRYDQGICAKTIKVYRGNAKLLALLKENRSWVTDAQARLSLKLLIPYLEGDDAGYLVLKKEYLLSFVAIPDGWDPNRLGYWEHEFLPDGQKMGNTVLLSERHFLRRYKYPWLKGR